MTSSLYNRDILRLAASIPHFGRLADAEASVEKSSALCGSRVIVDVALDGEGRIVELGQEVSACALGQASAALMGGHAIGRDAAEIGAARDMLGAYLKGEAPDPGNWPGLAVFAEARRFPARHAAILLAFEAAAEAARIASRVEQG